MAGRRAYRQLFFRTHAQRWHAHHHTTGTGHLYQGRYKSFPVQEDVHLLTVCRYVERNPVRAGLMRRAEAWRWGSLWRRGPEEEAAAPVLTPWPVPRLRNWRAYVNASQTLAEEAAYSTGTAVRRSGLARAGRPPAEPGDQVSSARQTAEA